MEPTFEDVWSELIKNEKSLENMVSDPIHRAEISGKMLLSKEGQEFEYFGDKFLTMEDFWTQLTDENRLFLLGHTMSMSVIHHYYGKYDAIFKAMSTILEQNLKMKNEVDKEIAAGLTGNNSKPSYVG